MNPSKMNKSFSPSDLEKGLVIFFFFFHELFFFSKQSFKYFQRLWLDQLKVLKIMDMLFLLELRKFLDF